MRGLETYTERAARRFLAGLPYASPAEAVEAGARSIQAWCDALTAARAEEGVRAYRAVNPRPSQLREAA